MPNQNIDPTLPDRWVPTKGWRPDREAPGVFHENFNDLMHARIRAQVVRLHPVRWVEARITPLSFMQGGHECVDGCRAYVAMEAKHHVLYLRHGEELCEIDFDAPEVEGANAKRISDAIGRWLDGIHGYGAFTTRGVSL